MIHESIYLYIYLYLYIYISISIYIYIYIYNYIQYVNIYIYFLVWKTLLRYLAVSHKSRAPNSTERSLPHACETLLRCLAVFLCLHSCVDLLPGRLQGSVVTPGNRIRHSPFAWQSLEWGPHKTASKFWTKQGSSRDVFHVYAKGKKRSCIQKQLCIGKLPQFFFVLRSSQKVGAHYDMIRCCQCRKPSFVETEDSI